MNSNPFPAQIKHRHTRLICSALLAAILLVAGFGSQSGANPVEPLSEPKLAAFIDQNTLACAQGPVNGCFQRGFRLLDRDSDGRLGSMELTSAKIVFTEWFGRNYERLAPLDRQNLQAGLLTLEFIGVNRVIEMYDLNSDSALDELELQAHVNLDERPFPIWVRDENSIDWPAMLARLGPQARLALQFINGVN